MVVLVVRRRIKERMRQLLRNREGHVVQGSGAPREATRKEQLLGSLQQASNHSSTPAEAAAHGRNLG